MVNVEADFDHCSRLEQQEREVRHSKVCSLISMRADQTHFIESRIPQAKHEASQGRDAQSHAWGGHARSVRTLEGHRRGKTPAEIVQAGEDPIAVQRAHAEYWQVMSLQMQGLSIA